MALLEAQVKVMAGGNPLVPLHHIDRNETFALLIQHLTHKDLATLLMEPPHRHDLHEIFLVTQGSSGQTIDDHGYNFSINTVGLLAKGQVHQVLTMTEFEIWTVFFDEDILTKQLQGLCLSLFHFRSQQQFYLNTTECALLESLFQAMVTVQADQQHSYAQANLLQHYLGTLLWHIERINHKHYQQNKTSKLEHYEPCQLFLGLLEQNFEKEHSVKFYADTLQLSGRQLSEITKAALGKSAKELLEERLTLEAKRLIRYSDLNSQEISYRLGFDDPSYFSRFFKRNTHYSPLAFRKLSAGS